MPDDERHDDPITKDDTTLNMRERADLRRLAARTLKRILSDENPPRNAGVLVAAASTILERTWPKPSVSANASVQVNVLVNGGVTAIERWERRHEEEDEVAGASRTGE